MKKTLCIKLFLIVGFICLPNFLMAQPNMEDVVYLKNGSVLRGTIIEFDENVSLKIEISGGSQFFLLYDEVLSVQREEKVIGKYYKDKGYVNYSGVDVLPGHPNNANRYQMINGYQINTRLSAGVGIAFVTYDDPINAVPVFLDIRFKLLEENTTPFLFFKGGYSFSTNDDKSRLIGIHSGGLMMNVGGGLQFDLSHGYGWYLNVGYNIESFEYSEDDPWRGGVLETELDYKRVSFGIGLTF